MKKIYSLFIIFFIFNCVSHAQIGWKLLHTFQYGGSRIFFKDSLNGFAYPAPSGIYKTTDGGKNWTVLNVQNLNSDIVRMIAVNQTTLIGIGTNGTIVKSTDGGTSWRTKTIGSTDYLISICSTPDNKLFICSTESMYKSTDSGENWSKYSLDTLTISHIIRDVSFTDANTGYGVGDNEITIKTTDGGNKWLKITPILNSSMERIKFIDKNTGYVLAGSDIAKTTDGGKSWVKKYHAGWTKLNDITIIGDKTVWVAGNDKIMKSTNGGENWFLQSFPSGGDLLSVFSIDSLTCYAGTGGWSINDAGSVYKTTNGGISGPSLTSPDYGSVDMSLVLQISWSSPENGNPYRLQVAEDYFFNKIIIDTVTNTASAQVKVPKMNTTYYWRVEEKFGNIYSPFSDIWNFKTTNGAPVLSSPVNNSIDNSLTTTFSWSDITLNPGYYNLQLSTNSAFSAVSFNYDHVTGNSQQINNLADSTTYYWRVRVNVNNTFSNWSNTWKFTTLAKTPRLLSPANNSQRNEILNLALQWSNTASTNEYRLQVSTDSLFHSSLIDQDKITGNSLSVNLSYSTKYYWRVGAKNTDGKTYWSKYYKLTTKFPPQRSFPLAVGNKWYYKANANYQNYYGVVKEITDTLSDGTRVVKAKYYYDDSTSTKKESWKYKDGKFYIPSSLSIYVYDDYLTQDSCEYPYTSFGNTCWSLINYKVFGINDTAQEYSYFFGIHGSSTSQVIDLLPDIGIVKIYNRNYYSGLSVKEDSSYLVGMYKNGIVLGDTTLHNPADTATAFFPLEPGRKLTYHLVYNYEDKNEKVIREITKILDNGFREVTATYLYNDSTVIKKEYWLSKDRKFYMSDSPDMSSAELCYSAALMGKDCIRKTDGRDFCITWKTDKFNFKDKLYDAQYFTIAYPYTSPNKYHIIANGLGPVKLEFWSNQAGDRKEELTDVTTDINIRNNPQPKNYALSQNYPNPFNPVTVISYQLPAAGNVTLKVYDILGKEVATLVNEEKTGGYYNVNFNGSSLSSGVYFYRLQSGSFVETKKLILMK